MRRLGSAAKVKFWPLNDDFGACWGADWARQTTRMPPQKAIVAKKTTIFFLNRGTLDRVKWVFLQVI